MRIMKCIPIPVILFIIMASGIALAENNVGTMVALKGKAIIERDKKGLEAKIKDSILLNDTVSTLETSRAKMLFADDSVLTLGEKSKAFIKEFVYSKDKGGNSIFSLVEGKMRSIVGKTKFEVHTPTAVAAARGTVILFETGVKNGKKFTIIICIQGIVTGGSSDKTIPGSFTLEPGMMITIVEGELLPDTIMAPGDLINRLLMETDISHELTIPGPAQIIVPPGQIPVETEKMLPPVSMDPGTIKHTTPVNIELDWQK